MEKKSNYWITYWIYKDYYTTTIINKAPQVNKINKCL